MSHWKMSGVRRRVFLALLVLLFQNLWALAAQGESSSIRGTVFFKPQEPLEAAEVTLTGPELWKGSRIVLTDERGCFRFPGLSTGMYLLHIRKNGYAPLLEQSVRLHYREKKYLCFYLVERELISSDMNTRLLQEVLLPDQAAVSSRMPAEYLQHVPSGRSLLGQLRHAVGLHHESAFGASEGLAQSFRMDGLILDDPETGALAADLDYDAVEEILVSGPGLSAQYGGFSGALVNVISRTGGNTVQGLFTLFTQLPEWHSNNSPDPDLAQQRFEEAHGAHFSLAGPLLQNKLWFFASGRFGYWKEYIEEWPSEFSEWGNDWRVLSKATWLMSSDHSLRGWAEWSHSRVENIEAGPFVSSEAVPIQNLEQKLFNLAWTGNFGTYTGIHVRFGGMLQSGGLVLSSDSPPHFDLATGVLSENYWEFWDFPRKRYSLSGVMNHYVPGGALGRHALLFGVEGELAPVRDHRGYPGGEFYLDYLGEPGLKISWAGYDRRPKNQVFTAFLDDTWSWSDHLILSLGLRLTHARGFLEEYEAAAFAPQIGLSPRLGVVWDIRGDQKTLFKAHYGKYDHGMRAAYYMNLAPEGTYQEYARADDQWILYYEDPWEEYQIDPELRLPHVHQVVISVEQALFPDATCSVSFIYKSHHDFIDRVNLSGDWTEIHFMNERIGESFPAFQRTNPGENRFLLTNPSTEIDYTAEWDAAFPDIVSFTPSRRYRGLALRFDKRFSHGWQLHASYVFSRSWGTDDNLWGEFGERRTSGLGASLLFGNPNYQINADGRLTIDPTHLVKVSGSAIIPKIDVVLGFFYSFASGETYSRQIWVPDSIDPDPVSSFNEYVYILGEERGSFRFPSQHNLDLRLEKFFIRSRFRLGILVDVFNLFNTGTPTQVETQINPWTEYQFGEALSLRYPRTFRMGFRFEF